MNGKPTEQPSPDVRCPKCTAALPEELERCEACGYTLAGIKLYKPAHFVWQAFLFSGMTPITMAAMNFGRAGRKRTKWRWLGLGFAGFTALLLLLAFMPPFGGLSTLFGLAINLPIGWFARERQGELYRAALRLGAKQASTVLGILAGLGVTLLAMVIPAVSFTAYWEVQFERGLAALDEDRCEDAAGLFGRLHILDDQDEYVTFNLGLAESCLEQWQPCLTHFSEYVVHHHDDADAHAMIGHCLQGSGREAEAYQSFLRARRLDPAVFYMLEVDSGGSALRTVEGTDHERRSVEELRAVLEAPARDPTVSWSVILGPGVLQALGDGPLEFGEPSGLDGKEDYFLGWWVDPEDLPAIARSDDLRRMLGRGIDGPARPADRTERELLRNVVSWEIVAEPASVIEDGDHRLLIQVDDHHEVLWLDLISEYPIVAEQLRGDRAMKTYDEYEGDEEE